MIDFFLDQKSKSNEIDTKKLEKELIEAKNLTEFLAISDKHLKTMPKYNEVIVQYMAHKGLKKTQVIKNGHLQKTQAYDTFKGKALPSRDKMICMIFGMKMCVADGQYLLQSCGYAPLNTKCKRDATFIYGLNNKLDLINVNIILDQREQLLLDLY